jgi:hypothetical protein
MNCRDIADLIETVDYARQIFERIRTYTRPAGEDWGNSTVEKLAAAGLEAMK